MKNRKTYSINQLILYRLLLISTLSLLIPGFFLIYSEVVDFRDQSNQLRGDYIKSQRQVLQQEVERAVDYINYKKDQKEKRLKSDIKNRVMEAHALCENLVAMHPATETSRIQFMVKEALRPIRFNHGRGYYFAFDLKGIEQLFPVNPAMEGKDMTQTTGAKGERVVPDMLDIVEKHGEGFYTYTWPKPGISGYYPKIAFVKKVESLGWVIGTGEYLDDVEKDIQNEIIDRISMIRFENDGYVFAGDWQGKSLSGPARGRDMYDVEDENGVKIVQELIRAAKNGGGFVSYVLPRFEGMKSAPKLSYAAPVDEWAWYIGSGVYVDEIEATIKEQAAQLRSHIIYHLLMITVTLLIIWTVIFFMVKLLAQRTLKSFSLFSEFFSRASSSLIPIREDDIEIEEFAELAHLANEMIDKRIEAERTLQASEAKYRTLFEKSKDAILIIDNYRFVDCNQSTVEMLGYESKEQLLQTHPSELSPEFQPDGSDSFTKARKMMDIATQNGSHRFEWNHSRANGEVFPVEVILTAITTDKEGSILHTTWRDITQRKQAEREKILAERHAANQSKHALVGQIAGKMAHDFNNILGVIMGNTELCQMACRDEEITRRLDLIFGQTVRGKNLTKNLIAFARDQEPKQAFFHINEKIELVINLMKKDLEGITIERDYGDRMAELLADPGMIEHALVNLIQNAIHALSKTRNPKIRIQTFENDKNICFRIEDNGCGIPQQHINDIFEPSFTLKGSRDTDGDYPEEVKGTGYGMANVKRYLEQHMGTIEVASVRGQGTVIIVSMPVIKRELSNEEKVQVKAAMKAAGKKILLVEDESAISDVQREILSHEPCRHHVDVAGNGESAIALFESKPYDVVSLDYLLPGEMNGMDVYRHIRERDPKIPILFISGNIEFIEALDDLLSADPNIAHLSKPCFNADYVNKINELLVAYTQNNEVAV